MSSECDKCGQEDPYCQCELYELRRRVEKLEELWGKLAFAVLGLESHFKASHSAPVAPAPQGEEASETEHKGSAPQSDS